MAFAEKTEVSAEKTLAEIMTVIRSNEGGQIAQFDDVDRFIIAFTMASRQVRFTVRFAPPSDDKFARVKVNASATREATHDERLARWEQHRRQRMRALLLVIRAKLESVASQVETFEEAFLANVVTATGDTVFDRIKGQIAVEYETGKIAPLMLTGPGGRG